MSVKSILAVTGVSLAALQAQAGIVTITFEGSIQNVDDPAGILGGAERWSASIVVDTDEPPLRSRTSIESTTHYYGGAVEYAIGPNITGSVMGELQVTDADVSVDPYGFDALAIRMPWSGLNAGGFYALDFSGQVFDSAAIPEPGLTFGDGFSPGIVGTEYNNGGVFAEIVTDTITVTPTPGALGVVACGFLAAGRRRR